MPQKRIANIRQRTGVVWKNASDRILNSKGLSLAGKTSYSEIMSDGLVTLRHYLPLKDEHGNEIKPTHRVPLVIVPPLAVNMLIYDLFPTRSFVRYFLARGYDVYLIDWGRPSMRQTRYTLATYIKDLMPHYIAKIRERSGQQELSLHGWSLGGVMALTYTALFLDKNIKNLIIVGSPIDTHQSGYMGKAYQQIQRGANWVRGNTNFRLKKLPKSFFHIHGWRNAIAFKMTDPVGTARGYIELLKNLGDREFIINHATSASFLNDMQAYPGGVTQDLILRFWIDNELSTGQMQFGDHVAKLSDINCSLLAVAGKGDNMVTRDAVSPLLNLVSSADKTFELVPGGHMGIVSGSKAPDTVWPITATWLATRSN
jgi:polyhydroxyalkanoate synthase